MTMIFDTLKLSKTLQSDFTPQQADALAQAISSSTSDGLFTKADAALARVEILAEIGDLRDELREFRTSVAKDMAELRASVSNDIAGLRASTDKDIAELRASVSNDIAGLRASTDKDIAELRASVSSEIAELRASTETVLANFRLSIAKDLAAFKTDIIKWIVTAIAFNFLATAALIVGLSKTFGH